MIRSARKPLRGAFALTEPIPYVGVDTGMLGGKIRIAGWNQDEEPWLQVDKRGRFITNIAFANFVTAAVNSDDPRIKGTCVVILEETDEGTFERGTATKKLVHQLSSTGDPVFNLTVPASRIVGGYTVKDSVIVPNFTHSEVIEAVFRRTRVTVGLMTAAKLLSAIEPVIRYQRSRFRGAEGARPGTIRFEQGIQQREDALHRLVDVWACGEAAASLGFAAARIFDELDPLEEQKNLILMGHGISGGRAEIKALRESELRAIELLGMRSSDPRRAELAADPLVHFALMDAEANVLCPATKLWNTGHGANIMREAVSLMGGYGITEDCPGFLASKWMDAQLEATYEGPEAVQRRQLTVTMASEVFLALFRAWSSEMRRIASIRPGTGACTLATAMQMWLWTLNHLQNSTDPSGGKLFHSQRQGVTFAMADALCWLLASRSQILDVLELEARGAGDTALAELLARHRPVPQRPVPRAGRQGCRRGQPHLGRARLRLQAPSLLERRRLRRVLLRQRNRGVRGDHARHYRHGARRPPGRRQPSRQGRPLRRLRPRKRLSQPAKQARPLPQRIAPGQGPRRRDRRTVMIPEALDYPQ